MKGRTFSDLHNVIHEFLLLGVIRSLQVSLTVPAAVWTEHTREACHNHDNRSEGKNTKYYEPAHRPFEICMEVLFKFCEFIHSSLQMI